MTYNIGDLVQFKLKHANAKNVWRALPVLETNWQYGSTRLEYLFKNYNAKIWNAARMSETFWKETTKTGMIVMGFKDLCFTKSKLPALQKAATKKFAQVMVFSSDPHQAPQTVWALAEELEGYSDKPYMEQLKARLREAVAQKAKQPTNV